MDDEYNDKKDSNENLEDIFGSFFNNSDIKKENNMCKETEIELKSNFIDSLDNKSEIQDINSKNGNHKNKKDKFDDEKILYSNTGNTAYQMNVNSEQNTEKWNTKGIIEGNIAGESVNDLNELYRRGNKSKSESDCGFDQPFTDSNKNKDYNNNKNIENGMENKTTKENRGHKNVHHGEIAKNQITHTHFEGFVDKFFGDIDGKVFDKYTQKVDVFVHNYKQQDIKNTEKLVSAIIDDADMPEICEKDKIMRLKAVSSEDCVVIYDVEQFFSKNGIDPEIEEDEITQYYKKQNSINNKRRTTLKHAVETRMIYYSCIQAIKIMDDNIFKLYLKRLRNKKKYRYEDFIFDLLALIGRKKELIDELKQYDVYRDYMFDTSRLFCDENVNSKSFDYKTKKFFT